MKGTKKCGKWLNFQPTKILANKLSTVFLTDKVRSRYSNKRPPTNVKFSEIYYIPTRAVARGGGLRANVFQNIHFSRPLPSQPLTCILPPPPVPQLLIPCYNPDIHAYQRSAFIFLHLNRFSWKCFSYTRHIPHSIVFDNFRIFLSLLKSN